MAQLYFRYSTMGAGESIEVQKVAFNYEERGQNPLILTSSLDDRCGKNRCCGVTSWTKKKSDSSEE